MPYCQILPSIFLFKNHDFWSQLTSTIVFAHNLNSLFSPACEVLVRLCVSMEMILPQFLWNVCNVHKEEEDQLEYLGSLLGPVGGPQLYECLSLRFSLLLTQNTSTSGRNHTALECIGITKCHRLHNNLLHWCHELGQVALIRSFCCLWIKKKMPVVVGWRGVWRSLCGDLK